MSFFKETYMTAGGLALAASFMIGQPWAFYVAAAIGTMISDPEGMTDSAHNWHTTDRSGATGELDELDTQLANLKTQLRDQGTWEGEAFTAFETIHASYRDSVEQLKETRNATGDAVNSTATFYKWGAGFCLAIATGMMAVGIYSICSKASPITALISEGVKATLGRITLAAVKKVLGKQVLVAGGLALALQMAISSSEAAGKIFPTLTAMPNELSLSPDGTSMPFMNDGMTYDETVGTLMPEMSDSLSPESEEDPATGLAPGAGENSPVI